MFKKLARVLALALVIAMMVTSMTSCDAIKEFIDGIFNKECTEHVDADGDFICDNKGCGAVVRLQGNYTYNTYLQEFPTQWNPHTYQTATDSEILDYSTVGFYSFDFNDTMDGFVIVPEMAAEMPIDVTADYVGEEWGITEEETGRAYLITLRDDLRWETGEKITANDFRESARRLLDPKAINYRADSLYSGDLAIVNAKDHFYSNRDVTVGAHNEFDTYSTDLDDKLVFTLGPGDVECYVRTWVGFPASYDVAKTAAWLIANYGGYMNGPAFTPEAAVKMEGKTIAEIKADPELAAAWESALGFANALSSAGGLVWCTYTGTYPETPFDEVGIIALSDTELVLILESSLEGFYLNYSLGTDLGLVHLATYDACAGVDAETGLYTNTYGTSVDTYKSFGPYKLTAFELDKQIVLETNDQWYGYTDPAYAGQYQTTKVVYDHYENSDTAFTAFLQGKLDSKGLEAKNIADYTGSERIYYTDGSSTWFVALNPDESAFAEWETTHEGYDKSPLTVKEFRMALSFSLDRQDFINSLDPMGSIGLALFNNMICSDPENGIMYRTEEAAKDAILEFWGVSQDDIGPGELYPDKDEAIASITGYNLAGAKELFNTAYDKAVELGIYDGNETVQICVGIPSQADFYNNGYEFLKNCWTKAVEGTKFEGKLEFVQDTTVGNDFADALRANTIDLLFGVGWTGSALNPYGLIGAYTQPDYQYDPSWNTSTAMMQFTIEGVTYEASVLDWTSAIEGETITIKNVATGETKDYSCGTADERPVERVLLLAAIEGAVLRNYDMIPTHNQASASLLGHQVEYGVQEYVYGVGRGGIKYMTYNYTDEEWDAFVAEQGGILEYK